MQNRPLSEIIVSLLSSGQFFTDIHIESGLPIMLRHSPSNWVKASVDSGQEYIAHHEQIVSFLNGIFVGSEEIAPKTTTGQRWKTDLHEKGSLHPAVNLSKLEEDGNLSTYRMRCTVQKQMMGESIGLVLRPLREIPESIHSLGLPFQVEKMIRSAYRGMIVVTGPTGSGKSTTLAAMVDEINRNRHGNILTIEDPVEFVHERKKCIINQREIGIDVNTFADGVHDALRFVPDVILIGEIRDAATMRATLRAAESGHLVITSMHAPTTVAAIRKMLAYLADSTADMQSMVFSLVGVIAQALVMDKHVPGKNHLVSEVLDCRDQRIINAILDSSTGEDSKQKLNMLEKQITSGQIDSALPMIAAVRKVVSSGAVEMNVAMSALTTNEERAELMKTARMT